MPARSINDRLANGDALLLDGATGSELHRRGVNVSKGATAEQSGPWSATANVDAPEVVRQVHEDYLRQGADIITSNNFWTSRAQLATIGLGDEWERYTRAAGELALAARDAVNPHAYVAGGIAPPERGDVYREYVDQARVLTELGVDLLLAEFVGSIDAAVAAVDACASVDLPIFLGLHHIRADGTLFSGERFDVLLRALDERRVDAIFLMCSDPSNISAALPALRAVWSGPIGAYANIGYRHNPKFGKMEGETDFYTFFENDYTPQRYAEFAREWLTLGAQIIGGCCGTTPEHIAAVAEVINGRPQPAS